MINVKGKWALITGASRGVGYQTAKFMAEQGCNLFCTAGRFLPAQSFTGMTLEDAVAKAETMDATPYVI